MDDAAKRRVDDNREDESTALEQHNARAAVRFYPMDQRHMP
jgi:hypothetical protein